MNRLAGLLFLSLGLTYFTVSEAQVPHGGKCPTVKPQDTFNVTQYLGKWYEIRRFPLFFEMGSCIRAEYSLRPDGKVKVDNRYIDGKEVHSIGEAYQPDPKNEPAVLSVKFSEGVPAAEYKVINTDYKTYSLVFSCESLGGIANLQFAWILSRELTLSEEITDRLVQELGSFNVDTSAFLVTNQTGCSL